MSSSSSYSGKSKPWSFTLTPSASKTTSGTSAAQTTFVPGVVFNLTLAGGNDDEAVYSLPMTFGHDLANSAASRRRAPTTPTSAQTINMLVDLGSSDMWIASMSCTSKDCDDAPALFNNTHSLESDTNAHLDYQVGSVSGEIVWEQVTVGDFGIGYQAMVAADRVFNENLGIGNFTGLLGLALPANSVITQTIPGTTSSSPDGATFLDNLFGAGSSAPTNRYFSLSLGRRDDVRTYSTFGIGEVDYNLCPEPCAPKYISIVPQPTLGRTGYLHWRIPLDGIKTTIFDDTKNGVGPTTQSIPLGSTQTDANNTTPLAILDSGGVAILVGSRPWLDSIYGAYKIKASADGLYRMPCTQPLSFTLTFGGTDFPVHPLDMSWIDTRDPSLQTCIGALQYADNLDNRGDFVLGSSFLKNVYSIYRYPDQKLNPSTWQPTVGMQPLTDAATAVRDFYAVRNMRQPLSGVSSGNVAGGGGNAQQSAAASAGQHRVVSTAVIAACSVVGFFVMVAGAFCAWWFWWRRRLGETGIVEYKMAHMDPENSTDTLRSRKHVETQRQKSIVDGFSDFDVDSWRSTTAGNSVHGMPVVTEADDEKRLGETLSNHTRGSSLHASLLTSDPGSPPLVPYSDFGPGPQHPQHPGVPRTLSDPAGLRRERTRSSGLLLSPPGQTMRLVDVGPPSPPAARYPSLTPSISSISMGGMAGAYPTHQRVTNGTRTSEYDFLPVFSEATLTAGGDRRGSQASDRLSSDRRLSRASSYGYP